MERDRDIYCVSQPQIDDLWLTRAEVAERLKLPVSTLNGWASRGRGPRYAIFGRHARYRLIDVALWEEEQFLGAGAASATKACDPPP